MGASLCDEDNARTSARHPRVCARLAAQGAHGNEARRWARERARAVHPRKARAWSAPSRASRRGSSRRATAPPRARTAGRSSSRSRSEQAGFDRDDVAAPAREHDGSGDPRSRDGEGRRCQNPRATNALVADENASVHLPRQRSFVRVVATDEMAEAARWRALANPCGPTVRLTNGGVLWFPSEPSRLGC